MVSWEHARNSAILRYASNTGVWTDVWQPEKAQNKVQNEADLAMK